MMAFFVNKLSPMGLLIIKVPRRIPQILGAPNLITKLTLNERAVGLPPHLKF